MWSTCGEHNHDSCSPTVRRRATISLTTTRCTVPASHWQSDNTNTGNIDHSVRADMCIPKEKSRSLICLVMEPISIDTQYQWAAHRPNIPRSRLTGLDHLLHELYARAEETDESNSAANRFVAYTSKGLLLRSNSLLMQRYTANDSTRNHTGGERLHQPCQLRIVGEAEQLRDQEQPRTTVCLGMSHSFTPLPPSLSFIIYTSR